MRKAAGYFFPIILVILLNVLLLAWAVHASGKTFLQAIGIFPAFVSVLFLATGLTPSLVRPQKTHTLITCFTVLFAAFLMTPFELHDLPVFHPGTATIYSLTPLMLIRLLQAVILAPMTMHVSVRFPHRYGVPSKRIAGWYVISIALLFPVLFSSNFIQRLLSTLFLFLWLSYTLFHLFKNIFITIRNTNPENILDAQRARVMAFSFILANVPQWLRPVTFAFGLDGFSYNILLVFQLFIPIGITYAVLKHDLFGIDRILRRAMAYGAVSFILLALYLVISSGLTFFYVDALSTRPLTPVISLFITMLLFDPIRKVIQSGLDKVLYPDRLKFNSAVQSMQYLLARANRRDKIIQLLNEDFPHQIGAEWGALKLFPEPDVPPPNTAPGWSTRLVAGNVSLGGYWLGPRRAGPQYDSEEVIRLNALAGQAALAMAYANAYESLYQLNRDLEVRVREQTEQAIEDQKSIAAYEERQRIARDLHDSVTQQIFGIHLMARGLKAGAPPDAKEKLAELESLAHHTLKEMRLMLDHLRNATSNQPVNFSELVRNKCEEFSNRAGPEGGALLAIRLDISEDIIVYQTIANEALWVLAEALQNVIRHSDGRNVVVQVFCADYLQVQVMDDGTGFEIYSVSAGHYGLRGMRERVLALGGELNLQSSVGQGTIVSYKIPLPR